MENKMELIVNGENLEVDTGTTLVDIMKHLNIEGQVMATAVNMEVVKQDTWENYTPVDGDKIEMLQFVGGG
jgi:sulfur carrier protein